VVSGFNRLWRYFSTAAEMLSDSHNLAINGVLQHFQGRMT
jgi:hypothetical protein